MVCAERGIRSELRGRRGPDAGTASVRRWTASRTAEPRTADALNLLICCPRGQVVAALRRFFDVRPGEGRAVVITFLYVALAVAVVPARQANPQRPVPGRSTAPTSWSTSTSRCRSRCRWRCRSTRGSAPRRDRGRSSPARCSSSASTSSAFWYAVPLPRRAGAAGDLLRLGELLRHHRAGAGVDVRQLGVRHAAGAAAVRPDRQRRQRRAPSPAACSRASWRGASARSTCCWCWPRLIALAAVVVNLGWRVRRRDAVDSGGAAGDDAARRAARVDPRIALPAAAGGDGVPRRRSSRSGRSSSSASPPRSGYGADHGSADALLRRRSTSGWASSPSSSSCSSPGRRCAASASASRSCSCRLRSAFGSLLTLAFPTLFAVHADQRLRSGRCASRSTRRPSSCCTCRCRRT